jgi:hypothetical protein
MISNNKGQSILSEHAMIFFIVIAALVAITTFVQRGFEARIHDARNFMINSVINSGACDANCLQATGGNQIGYEYEPYYLLTVSDTQHNAQDTTGATTGNPKVLGAIYINSLNETDQTISTSDQLPPECAGANPPSYCGNVAM